MLRIDHPCARSRETEPGTDRGFSKRQPRDPIRRRGPKADLSLDRAGARPAGVPPAEPPSAGFVTQLSGQDDGLEPGAGDPVDRSLSEKRIAAAHQLPPSSLSATLHPRYRERRLCYTKTRATAVAIGERRCPDPQGQPGYLRVDTVHQGDAPAGQGVYHINAVDQVTQWEIVAATERISEAW